ncbi:MAG: hypothetical protein AAF533_00705 [Acidobacteriota bacterium]
MSRVILVVSLLVAPGMSVAQPVVSGLLVDGVPSTGSCVPATLTNVELYAVNVPEEGVDYTDWVYVKAGASAGGATLSGFSYLFLAGNFTGCDLDTDRHYSFLTAPGEGSSGDQLALDSTAFSLPEPGATTFQTVGETIASGFRQHVGTGLQLDGRGLPVPVDLGAGARSFPASGRGSVDIVFGALIDHQPALYEPGVACGFGGGVSHHLHPERGLIIGYNVYRQDDGGTVPSKESWQAEQWLGFIPVADEPGDLAGTVDLNGRPSDGDEYLFFSDADLPGLRDSPLGAPEPECARRYWYVIQPVVDGDYEAWTSETELARVPLGFEPKLPDGGIDITGDGEPEFFSPQAIHAGMPGLGLTVRGRPLLSAPVLGCTSADPLSANGRVELHAGSDGLELLVGAEAADVLGYDVYRLTGSERTRVNRSLLPAQGLDGGAVLVDTVLRGRRLSGTYEVEVVTSDGDASRVVGPFTVGAAERRDSRRRSR